MNVRTYFYVKLKKYNYGVFIMFFAKKCIISIVVIFSFYVWTYLRTYVQYVNRLRNITKYHNYSTCTVCNRVINSTVRYHTVQHRTSN